MTRGANKQFDRSETLDKAMHLFWEQGYADTGMAVLLERMEIGRQSLYDTYGSKRELFLESIDHYFKTRIGTLQTELSAPGSPLANFRRVIGMVEQHCCSGNGLGCMVVNTMAEVGTLDEDLSAVLHHKLKAMETMFRKVLESAKGAGEIEADAETLALARSTVSLALGVLLMGRSGAAPAMIRDTVRMHLKLIDTVDTSR